MKFMDKAIELIKINEKYILRWAIAFAILAFWLGVYRYVVSTPDADAEITANKF